MKKMCVCMWFQQLCFFLNSEFFISSNDVNFFFLKKSLIMIKRIRVNIVYSIRQYNDLFIIFLRGDERRLNINNFHKYTRTFRSHIVKKNQKMHIKRNNVFEISSLIKKTYFFLNYYGKKPVYKVNLV